MTIIIIHIIIIIIFFECHNSVEQANGISTEVPSVLISPILTHFPELQMEPSLYED